MELYDVQNLGIINRIWKRCGTTAITYPIKNVISDLNDALDWYFPLAFRAGKGWELDDNNETSAPIDTQSIVSGTNAYKFSDFTEKIINLIKLEAINEDGYGYSLIPENINNLPASFEELYLNTNKTTGTPLYYIKYGDFIYLRPTPDYAETNGLKAFFNRAASKFTFASCTTTFATDLVNATAHGLVANDSVIFQSSGTDLPSGITADTLYYVISSGLTADIFKVSATKGGSTITIADNGTGTHYFLKTNIVPGIIETHHPHLITQVCKTFLNDNNQKLLGTLLTDVLMAERKIKSDYYDREKDVKNIMTNAPIRGGRGFR